MNIKNKHAIILGFIIGIPLVSYVQCFIFKYHLFTVIMPNIVTVLVFYWIYNYLVDQKIIGE